MEPDLLLLKEMPYREFHPAFLTTCLVVLSLCRLRGLNLLRQKFLAVKSGAFSL
ncbi:MAG: hypothetical protein MUO88_16165 [Desulfobacterales bacterium]|nr:hypothetical protein [Desulfobacterales bacterium]